MHAVVAVASFVFPAISSSHYIPKEALLPVNIYIYIYIGGCGGVPPSPSPQFFPFFKIHFLVFHAKDEHIHDHLYCLPLLRLLSQDSFFFFEAIEQ